MKKAIKVFSWVSVVLFLLLCALPLYGMLIPALNGDTGENRTLTAFPEKSELSPSTFEAWFDDNFALRGVMAKLYNRLSVESGTEIINGVAVGKKDWLFYMNDGSEADIRRELHYSEAELERICRNQQKASDYLKSLGIEYYLLVCPDKHTVYPEYLPDGLSGYEGESRFDGMARALRANTDVKLADTRADVIAAKRRHEVYYKTDTHWNQYGAFAGYNTLMDLIEADFDTVHRVTEDECEITEDYQWQGGDMASFIGQTLDDMLVTYTVIDSAAVAGSIDFANTYGASDTAHAAVCYENPAHPEYPSAVVFRDSFTGNLAVFFANTFSRVTMVWSTSILSYVIEAEKPDIVIMEYVERYSGSAANGMDIPEPALVDYSSADDMPERTSEIQLCVDSFAENDNGTVSIVGWAFDPTRDAENGEKHIALRCNRKLIWAEVSDTARSDVTAHFSDSIGFNLDASGFKATINKKDLEKGRWEILLLLDDGKGHISWQNTGKSFSVKKSDLE